MKITQVEENSKVISMTIKSSSDDDINIMRHWVDEQHFLGEVFKIENKELIETLGWLYIKDIIEIDILITAVYNSCKKDRLKTISIVRKITNWKLSDIITYIDNFFSS